MIIPLILGLQLAYMGCLSTSRIAKVVYRLFSVALLDPLFVKPRRSPSASKKFLTVARGEKYVCWTWWRSWMEGSG